MSDVTRDFKICSHADSLHDCLMWCTQRLVGQALLLAGPGVLITMFIGGCFIKGIFADAYGWDW